MANINLKQQLNFLKRVLADITPDNPAYAAVTEQITNTEMRIANALASHGLRQLTQSEIDASWAGVEDENDE